MVPMASELSDRLDRWAVYGLLASIVAIPITRGFFLPIVADRLTIFECAALPMIALWALARTLSGSWRTIAFTPQLDGPLAAFWLVGAMSGITAFRLLGRQVLVTYAVELAILAYLLVYFVVVRDLLIRRRALGSLLQVWVATAVMVGCVSVIGIASMVNCVPPTSSLVYSNGRLLATFRNPNQVAAYMVPTLIVLASVWASTASTRFKWASGLATLCSAAVLFFCASRGGAVGALVGLVILVALAPTARVRRAGAALVVLVAALIVMALSLQARGNLCFNYLGNTVTAMTVRLPDSLSLARSMLGGSWSSPGGSQPAPVAPKAGPTTREGDAIPLGGDTATSFAFRGVMARIALRFALAHPLTGIGLGTMHKHVMDATNQQADVDAHNMLFTIVAETGFPGLALSAWCVLWLIVQEYRSMRRAHDSSTRVFRAGLLAALCGFLVMTISFDGQRQRILWTLLAVIYASLHVDRAARQSDSSAPDAVSAGSPASASFRAV